MKIVHICLGSFYIDNYSYQENMLPKYHKMQGHEVEILASLVSFDKNGNFTFLPKADNYINEYAIPVTRCAYKKGIWNRILRRYKLNLYEWLCERKPDIIFIHGPQFCSVSGVVSYAKKNPQTVIYADNHGDFSNSATNWFSKNILHKIIWRKCAQKLLPYTKKFYGVLPARVDFLVNMYKLPKEKAELLVMGCDDECAKAAAKPEIRDEIRSKHNIGDNDFLIVTGGKIDLYKTQTLLLMQAVSNMKTQNVKLIVFGSAVPELKDKINSLCCENVEYIGWIDANESYKYFSASEIAAFPGRHSVFWEQAAGQGLPLIVKYWEGTTHIDMGGNVRFLYNDSVDEIEKAICDAMSDYEHMKNVAQDNAHIFMYSDIAKRAIES